MATSIRLVRSLAEKPRATIRRLRDRAIASIVELVERRGLVDPAPRAAEEMAPRAERSWGPSPSTLPGVRLAIERQLEILERMRPYAADLSDLSRSRYQVNPAFDAMSAHTLELMIRVIQPRRILEVGSGPSAGVIFDLMDRVGLEVTFVEPTLSRLHRFLRPDDHDRYVVVSNLSPELARALSPNDLLFVDPSRTSDLEVILFEILPSLPSGAFVHLPARYPFHEAPLLRAFLAHNDAFQIRFWPSYLFQHHREALARIAPISGDVASLFIRKVS